MGIHFSYETSNERRRSLKTYVHFYNYHRSDSAVVCNPPISRMDKNTALTPNS
jgi:hypothetical protein